MRVDWDELTETNRIRCQRWHEGFGFMEGGWSGSDWANAAAGEMGEACNVVKKLRRAETGHPGALDQPFIDLRMNLEEEIADTIIYLDLLATYYGLDIQTAIIHKFNAVSEREGCPEKLLGR